MLSEKGVLERAFQAIDELAGKPFVAPIPERAGAVNPEPKDIAVAVSDAQGFVLVEVACTCSKCSFPHIHSPQDRRPQTKPLPAYSSTASASDS
jgi:hypothetical protein